jgi:hypothetical protein
MTHREYIMHRIYDTIEMEDGQERALDSKLIADNARLAQRMRSAR